MSLKLLLGTIVYKMKEKSFFLQDMLLYVDKVFVRVCACMARIMHGIFSV